MRKAPKLRKTWYDTTYPIRDKNTETSALSPASTYGHTDVNAAILAVLTHPTHPPTTRATRGFVLFGLREFGGADGPPLPMDEQLRGLPELPVLRAVSAVHVRRMRLRRAGLRTPLSCHGKPHRGKPLQSLG